MLLLTWIVATVAATGLAWLGVRSIVGGVAAPLPAPVPVISDGSAQSPVSSEDATFAAPRTTTTTYTLAGGSVTVRFSPDDVAVLSAVPAAGYETDMENEGAGTRIEFESDTDNHQSRLDVWWDGAPRHRIRENVEDRDNDSADDPDDANGPDD